MNLGITNPLGEYFTPSQISGIAPVELGANEVAWGRLEQLEAFCVEHGLPFERWCGSYPGQWEAERIVFDGTAVPRSYTVTENDIAVISEPEVRSLGSFDAILADLESASRSLPPLTVVCRDKDECQS
jgi:hypothetical protein